MKTELILAARSIIATTDPLGKLAEIAGTKTPREVRDEARADRGWLRLNDGWPKIASN